MWLLSVCTVPTRRLIPDDIQCFFFGKTARFFFRGGMDKSLEVFRDVGDMLLEVSQDSTVDIGCNAMNGNGRDPPHRREKEKRESQACSLPSSVAAGWRMPSMVQSRSIICPFVHVLMTKNG